MPSNISSIPPIVSPVQQDGSKAFTYIWYMFFKNLQSVVDTQSGVSLAEIEALLLSQPQLVTDIDNLNNKINEIYSFISSFDNLKQLNIDSILSEINSKSEMYFDLTPKLNNLEQKINEVDAKIQPDLSIKITELENKIKELEGYIHSVV